MTDNICVFNEVTNRCVKKESLIGKRIEKGLAPKKRVNKRKVEGVKDALKKAPPTPLTFRDMNLHYFQLCLNELKNASTIARVIHLYCDRYVLTVQFDNVFQKNVEIVVQKNKSEIRTYGVTGPYATELMRKAVVFAHNFSMSATSGTSLAKKVLSLLKTSKNNELEHVLNHVQRIEMREGSRAFVPDVLKEWRTEIRTRIKK